MALMAYRIHLPVINVFKIVFKVVKEAKLDFTQITCDRISSSRRRSFLCHRDADVPWLSLRLRSQPSLGSRKKGAGRNNQQEILGGAARQPSTCIVCAVAVCTAHSSTSWPADRRSIHTVFHASVVAKLHSGDSLRLLHHDRLEAFLRRSTALRPQLQRWAQSALWLTKNCSRRLHSTR